MSLRLAIQTFEHALQNVETEGGNAIKQWDALRHTYDNGGYENCFQIWILQEKRLDVRRVNLILQFQYQKHFDNLKSDIKTLVEKLVVILGLDGFWALYFVLGESLIRSRKALKTLVRIKKHRPQTDINEILLQLRAARDQYRRDFGRRGVKRDMSIFTLDDVHKAEAVLLPRLDDASTLLPLGSGTVSEIAGKDGAGGDNEGGEEKSEGARTSAKVIKFYTDGSNKNDQMHGADEGSGMVCGMDDDTDWASTESEDESGKHRVTPSKSLGSQFNSPRTPEQGRYASLPKDEEYDSESFLLSPPLLNIPITHHPNIRTSRGNKRKTDSDMDKEAEPLPLPSAKRLKPSTTSDAQLDSSHWGVDEELKIGSATLRRKDLATLDDGKWLNDEIINGWASYLANWSTYQVLCLPTFFFTALAGDLMTEPQMCYEKVERWTRKVDIFALDYLVIPIHQKNNHWSLAIITELSSIIKSSRKDHNEPNIPDVRNDEKTPLIITIDNLDDRGGAENSCISSILRSYIAREVESKKSLIISPQILHWKHSQNNTPLGEQNGWDCGVFTLINLERFLRNPATFIASLDESKPRTIDLQQQRSRIRSELFKLKDQKNNTQRVDGTSSVLVTTPLHKTVHPINQTNAQTSVQTDVQTNVQTESRADQSLGLPSPSPLKIVDSAVLSPSTQLKPDIPLGPGTSSSRLFSPKAFVQDKSSPAPNTSRQPREPFGLIQITSISALRTLAKSWWDLEITGPADINTSDFFGQDLWSYIVAAAGPICVPDFLASRERALALGTVTSDASPLPFEQYTARFISASRDLVNKLERSKATYDNSVQMCVFLAALVEIFEDLSGKIRTKLRELCTETQGERELLSGGLPGPRFNHHRERWLSDVEDRIRNLAEAESESERVQKEIGVIYSGVLLAQRNTKRVGDALLIAIKHIKEEIQGFILEEERARKQRDAEIQSLKGLLA